MFVLNDQIFTKNNNEYICIIAEVDRSEGCCSTVLLEKGNNNSQVGKLPKMGENEIENSVNN